MGDDGSVRKILTAKRREAPDNQSQGKVPETDGDDDDSDGDRPERLTIPISVSESADDNGVSE